MTDSWQNRARCRQEDPNSMQPEAATHAEVADALMVCEGCPVLEQCRAHAEGQAYAYGVHAGLWFGDHPTWEVVKVCAHEPCGQEFRTPVDAAGAASYCSPKCRVAAYRLRSKVPA